MSPIPKPPKAKNPVQKAIEALIAETQRKGSAVIDGVIVHPSDLAALRELMEDENATRSAVRSSIFGAPVLVTPPVGDQATGGPLTKAWKEHAERMKNQPLVLMGQAPVQGQRIDGVSWDEQMKHASKSQLERDLEASLWALSEVIIPAGPTEVAEHSPHQQGSTNRIKKVRNEFIDILCPCKTVLRFGRCPYLQGPGGPRCEEEVPRVEAGTVFCVFHRPGQPWKEGSRFYRCDYWDGSEPDGRCGRVATIEAADGRHWCSQEGHIA